MQVKVSLVLGVALCSWFFLACASGRPGPQQKANATDLLLEFQQVTNDSIAILLGNTLRMHTGRAHPDRLFPMLISVRSEADPQTPISTHLVINHQELRQILLQNGRRLESLGLVLGFTAAQDQSFREKEARDCVNFLAGKWGLLQVAVFEQRGKQIVRAHNVIVE